MTDKTIEHLAGEIFNCFGIDSRYGTGFVDAGKIQSILTQAIQTHTASLQAELKEVERQRDNLKFSMLGSSLNSNKADEIAASLRLENTKLKTKLQETTKQLIESQQRVKELMQVNQALCDKCNGVPNQ
jgi:regulator of replication initiation timing